MSTSQSRSGVSPLAPEGKRQDAASTFTCIGEGMVKAHRLSGGQLPKMLDELNKALAA